MTRGIGGLLARVRRLLGLESRQPPPPDEPQQRTGPAWSGAFLETGVKVLDTGGVKVRWKKEQLIRPSGTQAVPESVRRQRARQRALVLGASLTLLVTGAVYLPRFAVPRTIPPVVRGVWETDDGPYAGRRFEVRGKLLAFQVGDSAGQYTVHNVTRVWRTTQDDGTLFRVQYFHEGEPFEFSFVYIAGPPDRIRFANQPELLWARASGSRTLIPEFPF